MKTYLPSNIYSALLAMHFTEKVKESIEILPASLISQKLIEERDSVGLIPSCDLYKLEHVKVSNKISLSFDGILSQSYLYFVPDQNKFEKIFMRGDVSSNEVLLSKILFKERYDLQPVITLDTSILDFEENNYLIAGQENSNLFNKHNGVSFADQIAEFIDYPYVNFVAASFNENNLKSISNTVNNLDTKIEDGIVDLLEHIEIPSSFKDFISQNIDTVYFEMTSNEEEGLRELLKLPYLHGFVEGMIEVNFV